MKQKYDAIIVGTGAGGGAIGYALSKKSLKVLFIEKGLINKDQLSGDYAESFKSNNNDNISWPEILKKSGRDFNQIIESNTQKYPFVGSGVGGSTALYGMAMERFIKNDFNPRGKTIYNEKSNLPKNGWPIKYDDLLPYYNKAEKLYKVKGTKDPLKDNENFNYTSAPDINKSNKELFNFFKNKNLNPYILPRSCNFVDGCIECQGFLCPYNCKNDSYNTCINPAIENNGAEILSNAEAVRLLTNGNQIVGVECKIDNKIITKKADIYILAAGAIRTPAILLKSKNNYFPEGLANSSGLVGKNLMRHCIDLFLIKTKNKPPKNGFLKEIALNDYYSSYSEKRLGTFQSFGRIPSSKIILMNLIDDIFKNNNIKKVASIISLPIEKILDKAFSYTIAMNTIIEDLPYLANSVSIDRYNSKPIVNYTLHVYENQLIKEFRNKISEVLKPLKFIMIKQAEDNKRLAHVCGTCRMGTDPKDAVVNENCQSFIHKNLYIADASIFPTSGGTNPALTIIANALRIADNIS